jgi:hypothetical protein
MNNTAGTVTEVDILEQLVSAEQPGFSPEAARAILTLRFAPAALGRMNELAEKNRQGVLTEAERADLEKYLRVGAFLNIVQAKARLSLARAPSGGN